MTCCVCEGHKLSVAPNYSLVIHGMDLNGSTLADVGLLVALDLPGGPEYVSAIRRMWDAGHAIAPVDTRLPASERKRVLESLRPGAVIEADGELRSLPDGIPVEEGDAVVLATSGTSGEPKGVIHTHHSIAASANATSKALDVDPAADRWLACLPLAHIGGLAVVMRSIVTGTEVEVHDGFSAAAAIDAAKRGATLVSLVTRALNQVPAELFRTVLIGGAASPVDRPPNVIATYGMTETGSGAVYSAPGGTPVPLDGLELCIGPPNDRATAGTEGEIHLRGPMLFRGYRFRPSPFIADGWFPTGDLGSLSVDGALKVAGRKGDVIATGGEKVWPEPVERIIAARPDVAEVAVIGRPDPDWGHKVVAVVVTAYGSSDPELASVRASVLEQLPVWSAPKEIEFVPELPKTSLGKILRSLL